MIQLQPMQDNNVKKYPLIVCAKLTYEIKQGDTPFRLMLPQNQPIWFRQNVQVTFVIQDGQKPYLELQCYYNYEVREARHKAFEAWNRDGVFIDLGNPPSGTIKSFIDQNKASWVEGGKRVAGLLRWIYDGSIYDSRLRVKHYWSLAPERWNKFIHQVIGEAEDTYVVQEINSEFVMDKFGGDSLSEPIHFDILREAEASISSNPKSATIMMVVALEIGCKTALIAKNGEFEANFNGDNPPSLEHIYATMIPENFPNLRWSSTTIDDLTNLIGERNRLVHRGQFNLTDGAIRRRFNLIKDILFLLDWASGHDFFGHPFYYTRQRLQSDNFELTEDHTIGKIIQAQRISINVISSPID